MITTADNNGIAGGKRIDTFALQAPLAVGVQEINVCRWNGFERRTQITREDAVAIVKIIRRLSRKFCRYSHKKILGVFEYKLVAMIARNTA
ncbi:hypothetical protein ROS1_21560 [Roseibium sp. ROS1]